MTTLTSNGAAVRTVIATLLVVGVSLAPEARQRPAAADTARVSGRVVDGVTGRAVPATVVEVTQVEDNASIGFALTDESGAFTFAHVAAGTYEVRVVKGDAIGGLGQTRPRGTTDVLTVVAGRPVSNLKIPIWEQGSIRGTVFDENGEPLPFVPVKVIPWRSATNAEWDTPSLITLDGHDAETTTDDEGRYALTGLNPGDYVVVVAPTYESEPQTWEPTGMVVPSYLGRPYLWRGLPAPTPALDGSPRVYVDSYAPGTPALADATRIRLRDGDKREGIDIRLHLAPAVTLAGRVDARLGDADGFIVSLERTDEIRLPSAPRTQTTTVDGRFSFRVPAGEYALTAERVYAGMDVTDRDPEGLFARFPLSIRRDIHNLAVPLTRGVTVRIRIEADDPAAPPQDGTLVQFEELTPSESMLRPPRLDRPGVYAWDGVHPGPTWIRFPGTKAVLVDGVDATDRPIDIGKDSSSEIVLRTTADLGTVVGTVQEKGRPARNTMVLLFPADQSQWTYLGHGLRPAIADVVDRSGAFQIARLLPGQYLLVAVDDEYVGRGPVAGFLRTLLPAARPVRISGRETITINLAEVVR